MIKGSIIKKEEKEKAYTVKLKVPHDGRPPQNTKRKLHALSIGEHGWKCKRMARRVKNQVIMEERR